MKVGIQPREAT